MEILKEIVSDLTTKIIELERTKNAEIQLLKADLVAKDDMIKQMSEKLDYNLFVDELDLSQLKVEIAALKLIRQGI